MVGLRHAWRSCDSLDFEIVSCNAFESLLLAAGVRRLTCVRIATSAASHPVAPNAPNAPNAPELGVTVRIGCISDRRSADCLVAAGSLACKNGGVESPTGPGPIPQPNTTIYYTAIGASDAIGFGASVVVHAVLPTARTDVGTCRWRRASCSARGFTVNLNNLGFPAYVLSRQAAGSRNAIWPHDDGQLPRAGRHPS